MIKTAVLYLVLYSCKNCLATTTIKGFVRIVFVACLATIFEIAGLLLLNSYSLFLFFVNVFSIPLMFIGIRAKERTSILKWILLGYFYMIVINAVLEALWNQFGEKGSYIFYLMFSCGAVIVGVRIWKNYTKMQKGIFTVELLQKGKCKKTKGFYDSGNRLSDPYSKKGVNIVSEKLLRDLEILKDETGVMNGLGMEECNTPVYIPYQALGNESGMLEVYYIEELTIEGEKGRITIPNCPLGVTKDNLFEGKNYEIILNEEVF